MQKQAEINNETAIATQSDYAAIIERVLATGDLAKLGPQERVNYFNAVCRSVGLNPLTQPFQYITLNGKLVLYARRDATDQLRNLHHVSIQIVSREHLNDVYVVTARATMPEGRTDESVGAVAIGALKGDQLCNAIMKAETKAKRRVTLSICGLGFLDESEIETIPDVVMVEPQALPASSERKEVVKTVTELDGLIRELRAYGISNANIQNRMKELTGVEKRADLNAGQIVTCVESFEDWANELDARKRGEAQ